ncbi:D-alanyl-D-alanine carboxypeptidase [Paracoccus sp. Z330]|uniref:D-alanyl-D-alanine carboxypeptidase n=1 Tax=Paracoccus onchidii TaxID=3017813 RepID=A0ABT4ZCF1_9RHOB|nr:D-alanyl-D-alanine carboxypeptidase [Paracoccus onchidii]MDB6176959.1 D-alanyl-D-alanine carboxypeptidase [Paracoccus onchidii]
MSMIDRRAILGGLLATPALRAMGQEPSLFQRPPIKPVPATPQLITRSGLIGKVGYALIDRRDGTPIEVGGGDVAMPPASTMKALTALYALNKLGEDFRFRTRVMLSGDTLILAGGGDPVLSTDDLASLADQLVASGQPSPARFAVWGGALPSIDEIAPAQADHLAYNPALSGMILNFNRVHLGWQSGSGGARMSLQARAAANSPRAYTISAEAADQAQLFAYRKDDRREYWTVSRAAMRRPGSRWLPVRNPELYAGDVFQTLCRAKGLVLPNPEVIADLPAATEIAGHDSPGLPILLQDMLKYSTNLTAEAIGMRASGATGLRFSAKAMQDWYQAQGLAEGFDLRDHSGLSTESRVNATGLARAICLGGKANELAALLKRNPLDVDLGVLEARGYSVMAKTGTLNFVSNLAGHLLIDGNEGACFAILCTDAPRQQASVGQERPAGVFAWTRNAKRLQRDILTGWAEKMRSGVL